MKKELIAELFDCFENACENAGEITSNHIADIGKLIQRRKENIKRHKKI